MQLPNIPAQSYSPAPLGALDYADEMYYGPTDPGARYSYCIRLPRELQRAEMLLEQVRPGMLVTLLDYSPAHEFKSPFRTASSPLNFGAVLSGTYELHYNASHTGSRCYSAKPQEIVGRMGDSSGLFCIKAGNRVRMLSVSLDEAMIPDMLYGHEDYEDLIKKFNLANYGMNLFGTWALSPNIRIIASQILNCPLAGLNRKIYLESKALEIIALQLDKLKDDARTRIPMEKNDIRRLHEARDILYNSLENPPSLMELAAKVGINDFKLKRGFREIFGDTAYGMLRKYRMEKARGMLLQGGFNVAEVSAYVGYTNISHFIATFRKQYNVTPGDILQQTRRDYRINRQ